MLSKNYHMFGGFLAGFRAENNHLFVERKSFRHKLQKKSFYMPSYFGGAKQSQTLEAFLNGIL